MKKILASAGMIAALTTGALAQGEVMIEDLNSDGMYDLQELQAAFPSMDQATFNEIDADANGEVTENELQAAIDDGMMDGMDDG